LAIVEQQIDLPQSTDPRTSFQKPPEESLAVDVEVDLLRSPMVKNFYLYTPSSPLSDFLLIYTQKSDLYVTFLPPNVHVLELDKWKVFNRMCLQHQVLSAKLMCKLCANYVDPH